MYLNILVYYKQICRGLCTLQHSIFGRGCKRHSPGCHRRLLARHTSILDCTPMSCSRSTGRYLFVVYVDLQSTSPCCHLQFRLLICSSQNCGFVNWEWKQDSLHFFCSGFRHWTTSFWLCSNSSRGHLLCPSHLGRREHRRTRSLTHSLLFDYQSVVKVLYSVQWYLPFASTRCPESDRRLRRKSNNISVMSHDIWR